MLALRSVNVVVPATPLLDDTNTEVGNQVLAYVLTSDEEDSLDINNALVELEAAKAKHAETMMNIAKAKLERACAKPKASRAMNSSASHVSNRSGRTRLSRAQSEIGEDAPDHVLAVISNAASSDVVPPVAEQLSPNCDAVVSANIGGDPALSGHTGVGGPVPIQSHGLSLRAPSSSSPCR